MTESPSIVYITGYADNDLVPLIGGVWTLWHQEGMPLEMSHLSCQSKGARVDWCEAMADASLTNNLPALMGQLESFLDAATIADLKTGFMKLMNSGATYEQILAAKRGGATP